MRIGRSFRLAATGSIPLGSWLPRPPCPCRPRSIRSPRRSRASTTPKSTARSPSLAWSSTLTSPPDGTVRVDVWLTVAGCPLRDTITRDVTAAVSKLDGVSRVRVELDVMSEEQRRSLQATLRGGEAGARDPVRPAGLADQGVRGGQRQGRRRQVVGDGEPGRGPGRGRAEGRPARRGHLRPLGAADAGRDRAADQGRADDHAAVGPRRARDLGRHDEARQRAAADARADPAPAARAVPGRRVVGRPGRAADGPAAGHRGRRHLGRPADPGLGADRRHHPAAGLGRGGRAGGIARGPAAPAGRRA